MASERLFNSFIPPKNFYTPQKKQISGYAPEQQQKTCKLHSAVSKSGVDSKRCGLQCIQALQKNEDQVIVEKTEENDATSTHIQYRQYRIINSFGYLWFTWDNH